MRIGNLIQIETNVWVVMREVTQYPKAVIHKITDTTGDDRYMLMTWAAEPSARRMVGIYSRLNEAEKAVPWPPTTGVTPGLPPRPGTTKNPSPGPKAR